MKELSSSAIVSWLQLLARIYEEKKDYLTGLDAAIGDADHGANMARGFAAVAAKAPQFEGKDIGFIFKTSAMTLLSTVGGASGPLYGSFFLQAAGKSNGKTSLTAADLGACLEAGVAALTARGKAVFGDKTMMDVWLPVLDAYKASAADGDLVAALTKASEVAKTAAAATIPLVAKKGRASYLGERSAGHLDPGAESSSLLIEALLTIARQ
jgi:phosphoenolpyruvate---glycerone phosphotransferase subunit DhaL